MKPPPIPRGIEVLVKKAAVDPDFRERLIEERVAAAADIDLQLEPAEAAMLNSIPRNQLERTIDGTTVPQQLRNVFLGHVAALMLATLAPCALGGDDSWGSDPEYPESVTPRSRDRSRKANRRRRAPPKPKPAPIKASSLTPEELVRGFLDWLPGRGLDMRDSPYWDAFRRSVSKVMPIIAKRFEGKQLPERLVRVLGESGSPQAFDLLLIEYKRRPTRLTANSLGACLYEPYMKRLVGTIENPRHLRRFFEVLWADEWNKVSSLTPEQLETQARKELGQLRRRCQTDARAKTGK